jgi:enediyne biosynthesis protein E4
LTIIRVYIAVILLLNFACKAKVDQPAMFQSMENTGIAFNNRVMDSDSINILNYRNFYNGGGVAIGDINNDGLADIFFTANQGGNQLYLNKGGFKFSNISLSAGFSPKQQFSTGVVMADVNNDGWLDIYVSNAAQMFQPQLRKNQLFINNHNLSFTESAAAYGLDDMGYSTQASFFDYDLDGDLDCFVINNSPVPVNSLGYPKQRDLPAKDWPVEDYLKGGGDHLYRNDNNHFIEVNKTTGIHGSLMSFGLGVTVGDVNNDHYPDIYVSNDFFERDYLYINQRNGSFKDELELWIKHSSYASMGADFGDINNDGRVDIFTTDMLPAEDFRLKTTLSFDDIDQFRLKERNGFQRQYLQNTLQLNTGAQQFTDIANYSGVNASEWSWGGLFFDADNDGFLDIYICNGIYRDLTNQDFLDFDANEVKEQMIASGKKDLNALISRIPSIAVPNKLFRNLGNLKFADVGTDWGFSQNSFSNGASYGDLDNDGDLDLVVNNVNEPALVLKNNSNTLPGNNAVIIQLKSATLNKFAVGSKIVLYAGDEQLTREIMPSRGFQSSVDYKQVIGIGKRTTVDSVKIYWPNLSVTKIDHPAPNKLLVITDADQMPISKQPNRIREDSLFQLLATDFDRHNQPDYTDFYTENGIPQMLSHQGPYAAVADVNNDGMADVFIGGTALQPGELYLQKQGGVFGKKPIPELGHLPGFEDGPALFFDANGDGFRDLFISATGNSVTRSTKELQHRLLLNDGKGQFSLFTKAFPLNQDNIGAVVSFDFDGDGDMDVFAGSSCVTGEYGSTGISHIYRNDGSAVFKDLPVADLAGINSIGMVQAAIVADLDKDNQQELIITGAWMGTHIFHFNGKQFIEKTTNLTALSGYWQTIIPADINKDGKTDLVLGNLGENFSLHTDMEHPLKLWYGDFDNNGRIDKILTKTIDRKDKTVFMKREIQQELPMLKRQNLRHAVFAEKTIQELFDNGMLQKASVKTVNCFSSVVAINLGNGQFEIDTLPPVAQFSMIKTGIARDFNGDGSIDLLLCGNEFNFQPQLGCLDANEGLVLINNGKGKFAPSSEGLHLKGMVRNIIQITVNKKPAMLVLQNNEKPLVFLQKKSD